jgi:hypothetical protein
VATAASDTVFKAKTEKLYAFDCFESLDRDLLTTVNTNVSDLDFINENIENRKISSEQKSVDFTDISNFTDVKKEKVILVIEYFCSLVFIILRLVCILGFSSRRRN